MGLAMFVRDAQDAQDDAVRASASGRNFFFRDEALAVLRGLEEVRCLVVGSPYKVMVYTDHLALLSVLRGEGTKGSGAGHHKGRISSWMLRMSEYDVEYHHIKGEKNRIADGLSRMRNMSPPKDNLETWEDVAAVEEQSSVLEEQDESMGEVEMKGWEE